MAAGEQEAGKRRGDGEVGQEAKGTGHGSSSVF
jgi:hypothetical protein